MTMKIRIPVCLFIITANTQIMDTTIYEGNNVELIADDCLRVMNYDYLYLIRNFANLSDSFYAFSYLCRSHDLCHVLQSSSLFSCGWAFKSLRT